VVMKSTIFWDITPCTPMKVNRRFGGKCCIHVQDRRISRARNQREAGRKQSSSETSVDIQRTTWSYIPEYIYFYYLPIFLSLCLSLRFSIRLIYLPSYLPIYIYRSIYLSVYLSFHVSVSPYVCQSISMCAYLSLCMFSVSLSYLLNVADPFLSLFCFRRFF
jgi:hypothetical protein